MKTFIKNKNTISEKDNLLILTKNSNNLSILNLDIREKNYIDSEFKKEVDVIKINQYARIIIIINPKKNTDKNLYFEGVRCLAFKVFSEIKTLKTVIVQNLNNEVIETEAFVEGLALSNYDFDQFKTEKSKNKLETIFVYNHSDIKRLAELEKLVEAVKLTRDLVNTPFSHLKAIDLAQSAKKAGIDAGFTTSIFTKKKIQSLKMGGLLAVNQGSIDEPTFSILEWKPKNAKNKKPIILVGKGVVYDTGGLSLKPTANSMDIMKVDMAGAGTVIGAMHAIANNKLNQHVIGLIPATDNRPSGNAYAPGDVVTMFDKTTVEVLNTDAEGRMILADALSYAKKYKPELVIDLATLTGSAANTIGHFGIVSMQQKAINEHNNLAKSGHITHERLAEMPFWKDYDNLIKSDVADIKNLGGKFGGAITAGKFLAYFTDYPWIHLDIAGPAYVSTEYQYRSKGATGMGVRLLYDFIKNRK